MSQEDYDQGYWDGQLSMAKTIASVNQQLEMARQDLALEQAERRRYQDLLHARTAGDNQDVPF